MYIVLTGDLVHSGKREEYEKVSLLLRKLSGFLKVIYPKIKIDYVFIPGNHDCNFTYDSQARKNSIKNLTYENLGDDNSVVDLCIDVQKDFWDFYHKWLTELPDSKIFYQKNDTETSICFNCINSSWMSSFKENPGSLFFPIKKISCREKADINITLVHHPLNWFNPVMDENNVIEMRNFVDNNSDIVLFAHEHEEDGYTKTDTKTHKETYYRYGCALFTRNNRNIVESGFKTFIINPETKTVKEQEYSWIEEQKIYSNIHSTDLQIETSDTCKKKIENNHDFLINLKSIKIPLSFQNNIKPNILAIYVYPDLDDISSKKKEKKNNIVYIDSKELLNSKSKLTILEGDSQSGKSTLIEILYLGWLEKGYYPLLLKGEDIKDIEIDSLLRRNYKQQYKGRTFEEYQQYDDKFKIIFIDDLYKSKLNNKGKKMLLIP
ncbi:3' 5'-cyclic adenosine monophosphate phosphodiesterase CpdA [termite gut metagenome]|uniref:3' 5'-cyclic adenosine monophosphate phosphodiesterase CpdA n=1 Tax=termite gut metagenome TaxID=433724 RepID=A0A5J4R4R0_9ZZZZ